jgi:hypothetical protein
MAVQARRIALGIMLGIALAVGSFPAGRSAAQDGGGTCPALVEDAVSIVGTSCAGVGINEACYGHISVTATFQPDATGAAFGTAGDTAALIDLQTLVTEPADATLGTWGVALMKVQANLPDESGEAMTFVLFGDTEVTNAVDADLISATACTVTPLNVENVNVRSGPDISFSSNNVLAPGTEAPVTGRNEAGDWLRIDLDGTAGWVAEWVVTTDCDIQALPVVEGDEPGAVYTRPMQAITLSSGSPEAMTCTDAPDGLLIQSPDGQRARVMVNGVHLEFTSAGFLTAQPDGVLTISGLRGAIDVTAAGTTVVVRPGFRTTVPLTGLEASGPPTDPQTYTEIGVVPGLLRSLIEGEPFDPVTATAIFTGADLVIENGAYAETIASVDQNNVTGCSWYWAGEPIAVGYTYDDTATITLAEDGQSLTYEVEWGSGTLALVGGLTYSGTIGAGTAVSSDITITFTSPTTYTIEILDTSTNAECSGGTQLWRGEGTRQQ